MSFLGDLWLAILLSAVFVFIASSVMHMLLPLHRKDYTKMPGEEKVLEAMRGASVVPGQYMFPCSPSMKECGSPEMIAKFSEGPVGFMTVMRNGPPSMGKCLVLWFLYCILVSIFVAYLTSLALADRTVNIEYLMVFRLSGTIAVVAYALSPLVDTIWKSQRWGTSLKFVLDGVVYALVTAGTFGWLWPEVASGG